MPALYANTSPHIHLGGSQPRSAGRTTLTPSHHPSAVAGTGNGYRSSKFSGSSQLTDFTVKCEEFEWKVHGIILASGSKFFEKAFCGNFQEAADKVIILHDDKPEMVARMLLCLYTSRYPDHFHKFDGEAPLSLKQFLINGHPASNVDQFEYEENPLMIHSEMYAMAEKYDMPGLQALCVAKFDLKIRTYREVQNLVEALSHVYTSTPPSKMTLRLKAAALLQDTYRIVMHEPTLKALLESGFVQNGQLGWVVWSNLFNHRKLQCVDCKNDDYNPFEHDHGEDICFCGLTKLCGGSSCSNVAEEEYSCSKCANNKRNMKVKEC